MRALEHITILDLSRVPPGDFCSMILADFGANVIKVEEPPRGKGFQSPVGKEGEREAAFRAINRNKKSMVLNLRSAEGREVFLRLARQADIVIEGFRPGVTRKLGVDYDALRAINNKIIYCSMSGYGQDGPYQDFPGHDINYMAVAGALDLIKDREGNHVVPLNLIADIAGASMHAVTGILIALAAREKTGQGQAIDISYTDCAMGLLADIGSNYFLKGKAGFRAMSLEAFQRGELPYYNTYQTKDKKYISVGCMEPVFYQNLCEALGRGDLSPFQNGPPEKQREAVAFFKEKFATRTQDEWFELLSPANICFARVNTFADLLHDPQVIHRKMIADVPHPTIKNVKQIGVAIKLSDTPGEIRHVAPLLGQDTRAILRSAGYSDLEIENLARAEAVKLDL